MLYCLFPRCRHLPAFDSMGNSTTTHVGSCALFYILRIDNRDAWHQLQNYGNGEDAVLKLYEMGNNSA